eukprot:Plantae.Rhodophyta-Hildenbrandia_rubra.ctg13132.p1 GENE.Plantae.Rhodophyta-Hildenbrandia_rubra.ctg13132~~Plantae.Rhodophyta-Hildenbrandia_rubra.ctg13132.p1  ORF type:complete len:774 (-),score=189.06 Plantae.Rhodophyta-Hildenbrandia_rubra.ctg13132:511-2832(-)
MDRIGLAVLQTAVDEIRANPALLRQDKLSFLREFIIDFRNKVYCEDDNARKEGNRVGEEEIARAKEEKVKLSDQNSNSVTKAGEDVEKRNIDSQSPEQNGEVNDESAACEEKFDRNQRNEGVAQKHDEGSRRNEESGERRSKCEEGNSEVSRHFIEFAEEVVSCEKNNDFRNEVATQTGGSIKEKEEFVGNERDGGQQRNEAPKIHSHDAVESEDLGENRKESDRSERVVRNNAKILGRRNNIDGKRDECHDESGKSFAHNTKVAQESGAREKSKNYPKGSCKVEDEASNQGTEDENEITIKKRREGNEPSTNTSEQNSKAAEKSTMLGEEVDVFPARSKQNPERSSHDLQNRIERCEQWSEATEEDDEIVKERAAVEKKAESYGQRDKTSKQSSEILETDTRVVGKSGESVGQCKNSPVRSEVVEERERALGKNNFGGKNGESLNQGNGIRKQKTNIVGEKIAAEGRDKESLRECAEGEKAAAPHFAIKKGVKTDKDEEHVAHCVDAKDSNDDMDQLRFLSYIPGLDKASPALLERLNNPKTLSKLKELHNQLRENAGHIPSITRKCVNDPDIGPVLNELAAINARDSQSKDEMAENSGRNRSNASHSGLLAENGSVKKRKRMRKTLSDAQAPTIFPKTDLEEPMPDVVRVEDDDPWDELAFLRALDPEYQTYVLEFPGFEYASREVKKNLMVPGAAAKLKKFWDEIGQNPKGCTATTRRFLDDPDIGPALKNFVVRQRTKRKLYGVAKKSERRKPRLARQTEEKFNVEEVE